MTTVIDWDYVANLMNTVEIGRNASARREYLESRGFDVLSIVRGLVTGIDNISDDPALAGVITGSLMAGMEIAVRAMEAKELDDKIEQ